MSDFASSYLGRLRSLVGSRLLLVPGMRVVVEDPRGAILLQLRTDFRLWGLPGGVPDEGESAEAAAIRETEEETGIRIRELEPFGFASDPEHEVWTYPNGDRCHYFTLLYAARSFSGDLAGPNSESAQVAWFLPDRMPELLPVMRRTLDAYRRFRETGAFQSI
ncbi:NUDIX domain-containing protein [Enterovirga sp.]|jgi:ADP-ribose pyrophosphatase YjhB (NUDIX family)|uniref:NUDIX domain-containing protein n=1 Tax=Enterovirga sp. TaxID=2026350 RepID=UPI002638001D|nr:NUDIX domain-containing protein [Enterovirga sp.]MDB5589744.1 hydrolase [Enterovirga sp.]